MSCLDEGQLCVENMHYSFNYNTNEFLTGGICPGGYKYYKRVNKNDGRTILRCLFSCLDNKYANGYNCVDTCQKKYYKISNTGLKSCLTNCKNSNLYASGYLCVNKTQDKYVSEDWKCLSCCPRQKYIFNKTNTLYCVSTFYNNIFIMLLIFKKIKYALGNVLNLYLIITTVNINALKSVIVLISDIIRTNIT